MELREKWKSAGGRTNGSGGGTEGGGLEKDT